MRSNADSVADYLAELSEDRRTALETIRSVILQNLPEHITETMAWGMITYEVPMEISGNTYNGKPLMYAALASQKNHMALYLCGLYCIPDFQARFADCFAAPGGKLDMGKSCIRFKKLEDLDLACVAEAVSALSALSAKEFAAAAKR